MKRIGQVPVMGIGKKLLVVLLAVLIGAASFYMGEKMSSPATYKDTIETLDEMKQNATRLAMTATGASVAVSAIPDDTATPIAEKLSDLSMYMFFVVCVIYLEKYMLTIAGFLVFKGMIPIACGMMILFSFLNAVNLRKSAHKLIISGLILVSVVPAGVKVSSMIIDMKEYSVQETLEKAFGEADEVLTDEELEQAETEMDKIAEKKGFFETLLSLPGELYDSATATISAVSSALSNITLENAELLLNTLLEAVAVMVITSCAIPLVILVILSAVFKMLFQNNSTVVCCTGSCGEHH